MYQFSNLLVLTFGYFVDGFVALAVGFVT